MKSDLWLLKVLRLRKNSLEFHVYSVSDVLYLRGNERFKHFKIEIILPDKVKVNDSLPAD